MSGWHLNNNELKALFRKQSLHVDEIDALIKMAEQNGDRFDFCVSEVRGDLARGNENAVQAYATTEQLIEVQVDMRLRGVESEYGMGLEV